MNKPLSVTAKLGVLLVLAVMFGATLIALSTRTPHRDHAMSYFDNGSDDTKKIHETFAVASGGELFLDSDIGDLEITGGDGSEVTLDVAMEGSQKAMDKFNVNFSQDGNTVRVTGKSDRQVFRLFDHNALAVRYEIHVPKNFNLHLETSGGNIVLRGVEGMLEGETSGGDVDLADLDGTIKMRTSGGNIMLRNTKGDLTAETSGGNIHGEQVSGSTHVETSGGNITFRDSDGKLYASTSGGDVRVAMTDNKGVDVSTSGGSITLSFPKSIAANVEAETTGGDVSCDFAFAGRLRDGSLHGTINGGGSLIKAETSGGDIILNAAE